MQERLNPLDPVILKIKADKVPLEGDNLLVRTCETLKNGGVPILVVIKMASEFRPEPKSKK